MYITAKIAAPEEEVERRAQEFFAKRGRRPYGLVLQMAAQQLVQDYTARTAFAAAMEEL